jgi:hypothetical protein
MHTFISIFAYFIIFAAADIKRCSNCQIHFFDKEWFIQVGLIIIAAVMLSIG